MFIYRYPNIHGIHGKVFSYIYCIHCLNMNKTVKKINRFVFVHYLDMIFSLGMSLRLL